MIASAIQRFAKGGATTSVCLLNYICSYGAKINLEELNEFLIINSSAIQFMINSQINVSNNFYIIKYLCGLGLYNYTIIQSHKRHLYNNTITQNLYIN